MPKSGIYDAKVKSWSLGQSRKLDPMLMVEFEVAATPAAPAFTGYIYVPFSEKVLEKGFKSLEVLGYDGSNILDLDPESKTSHNFKGAKFKVVVSEEEKKDGNGEVILGRDNNPIMVCRFDLDIPRTITPLSDDSAQLVNEVNARFSNWKRKRGRVTEEAAEAVTY